VTLDEAKLYLKVDGDDDDGVISQLIAGVRDVAETYLQRSVVVNQVILNTDKMEIVLPYGPVATITSVQDEDGNDVDYSWDGTTLTSDQHMVISVTAGTSKPLTEVVYESDGVLPEGLKSALLQVLAKFYQHRGDEDLHSKSLMWVNTNLQPYRNFCWI
jgi:uncharacterized phiE125 gp8 family phage protein